jgi:hypothetical protein
LLIVRIITLSLLFSIATSALAAGPEFTELVIDAGFRVEQPVLVASLAGDDSRHIVLAGSDDDHQQRLAIYSIDHAGVPAAKPLYSMSPDGNLIAYDVGRLGDREALFFIEPGRILRYDFASGELVEAVKIRSVYAQERNGEILPIDFIRDVNQDDRDDLVVPDASGYRVRLQRKDGSLGAEAVLQESSNMNVSDGNVSFHSRPLFAGDMNFDGLADLGVWRGNSLRMYPQLPGALFEGQPNFIQLGLGLPSEAELRARRLNRSAIDVMGLVDKQIWLIQDLNNDQLPDILTETTLSEGVFDKRNMFRLYLGRRDGDQLTYQETEDAVLASEGLQYGLVITDIDGDGKQDILVRKVQLTFGKVIRALLSGHVSLQLHFFRMTDDDTFKKNANYVTKTSVNFSVSSGQVDIPAITVADFDADGLQDLMMQTDTSELSFFRGVPTASLFSERAVEIKVQLPRNGDLVATEDINGDGRADLILRYNASDSDELAHIVRLLLAEDN